MAAPDLRIDIKIHRVKNPAAQYGFNIIIEDPLNGRFHDIDTRAVPILMAMHRTSDMRGLVEDVMRQTAGSLEPEDIVEFINDLKKRGLLKGENGQTAQKPSLSLMARLKKSLFILIPIFRPDRFLGKTLPVIKPLFSKNMAIIMGCLALFAVILAGQNIQQLSHDMGLFFNLGAIPYFILVLFAIKAVHELAHAYAAKMAGASVESMGVAFMFFYPTFYTDVSSLWLVGSRRDKMRVNGAGLIAEMYLAIFALFLWGMLPAGNAGIVCLFVATVSLVSSIFINANPLMKFDGYFLLSDYFRLENMQQRALLMARWDMQRRLLGTAIPRPEVPETSEKTAFGLTCLGYVISVYRVFLYVGFAALASLFVPEPFGAWLGMFIIGAFLCLPALKEVAQWARLVKGLESKTRALQTVVLLCVAGALFFIPFFNDYRVAASLKPDAVNHYYSAVPARLEKLVKKQGQAVKKGDVMVVLSSLDVTAENEKAIKNLRHAKDEQNRFMVDKGLSQNRDVYQSRVQQAKEEMLKTQQSVDNLVIRATQDGVVLAQIDEAYIGQYVDIYQSLITVSYGETARLQAYVPSAIKQQMGWGDHADDTAEIITARFFPRSSLSATYDVKLSVAADTLVTAISEPALLEGYGGSIINDGKPTQNDMSNGASYPVAGGYYPLTGHIETAGIIRHYEPGVLVMDGPSYSVFDICKNGITRLLARLF